MGSPAVAALVRQVIPPDVYERIRPTYLQRMVELRSRRRVRLGADVVTLFENQETVLAQLHEQLRALPGPWTEARARGELEGLRGLLPAPGELALTLMIDGGPRADGERLSARLRAGAPVLALRVGDRDHVGTPAEDTLDVGCPIHFLRVPLGGQGVDPLQDPSCPVALVLDVPGAPVLTPLSPATRAALAADLQPAAGCSMLGRLAALGPGPSLH